LVPAIAMRAVAWVGVADPQAALDLLRRLQGQSDMVEGFEIIPASSLELVLQHIPGTRSPLDRKHCWHVLIEATSADAAKSPLAEIERILGEALEQGQIEDAAMASNEAQADAFWRIRDSISEAERATGGSIAHDIPVPVDDMPRFNNTGLSERPARLSNEKFCMLRAPI